MNKRQRKKFYNKDKRKKYGIYEFIRFMRDMDGNLCAHNYVIHNGLQRVLKARIMYDIHLLVNDKSISNDAIELCLNKPLLVKRNCRVCQAEYKINTAKSERCYI